MILNEKIPPAFVFLLKIKNSFDRIEEQNISRSTNNMWAMQVFLFIREWYCMEELEYRLSLPEPNQIYISRFLTHGVF